MMIGNLQIPMWTGWIIAYFFLGGIAGGAYFTAAIIELVGRPEDRPIARMGYYIAFPLVLVCAVLLALDLGQPLRFWHMVLYSRTLLPMPKWDSAISVGSYALLIFGLFSFLSFVDALMETGRLPGQRLRGAFRRPVRVVFAVLGAIAGFFLAAYTGVLLSTTFLPVWSTSPMLGALFLASGGSTGMAAIGLALILSRGRVGEGFARLKVADNVAIIVEIVLLIVFLVVLGAAAAPLLSGLSAVLLIGGVLIVGLLVPLILQVASGSRRITASPGLTVLVSALILLGGLLLRAVIILGGQGLI
jgi:formate-dependent nitrite reductase membrane component NrfD